MHYLKISLVTLVCLSACSSSEKFSGFAYDPPGVTDTSDKIITSQKKRTIGAGSPKVWVSNEFSSARMNDFYALNDSTYEVYIEPENAPINNSPWYSFKVWSDSSQTITLRINYKNGRHRYIPKVYFERNLFDNIPIDSLYNYDIDVEIDSLTGISEFDLQVGSEPLIVVSQYPFNQAFMEDLINTPQVAQKTKTRIIGYSHQQRPIYEIEVDDTKDDINKGVLILLSRQHPPEVSGFLSSLFFLEALMDDSELAVSFRDYFIVKAYPMINPDGVENGHWRHNAAGVDLNRDWENFNQPETQAVRDALLPLKEHPSTTVYYGIDFHSTNENIFYPINGEIKTDPDNLSQRWYELVVRDNPEIVFNSEEFDTSSPISKNWLFKTFGSDALTFEIDDELSAFDIESVSQSAAEHLMRLLIDEYINNN